MVSSNGADDTASPVSPAETSSASLIPSTASPRDCAAAAARPKRKKARRACGACQVAHLTCGDERPCLRCKKRGIAHNCQNGTRKKAKYLFDATDESLHFKKDASVLNNDAASSAAALQDRPPQSRLADATAIPPQYPPQAQNVSTPAAAIGQYAGNAASMITGNGQLTDMNLHDIDIADLNFDNYFGALEFGILGQLSSGAVAQDGLPISPSETSLNGYPTPTALKVGLGPYSPTGGQPLWRAQPQPGHSPAQYVSHSPNSLSQPLQVSQTSQARSMTMTHNHANEGSTARLKNSERPHQGPENEATSTSLASDTLGPARQNTSSLPIKRDPSHIYFAVTTPYSYTAGFHALTALLQERFTPSKTLRIAKALASIRPSFIASTKDLKLDDLTFMEKCFQRTLLQYDDFINAYGCPTIICRRTGELAAASKEFTQLTGWSGDVLLGNAPNENSNAGAEPNSSPQKPAAKRKGRLGTTNGRLQPIFLAQLLDEDSVVQFYEDFAELAFGDPRGHVVRPCKLLRYRPTGPGMRGPRSHDCMYCWSVKRDVFDIPMLIVINFLPILTK